MEPPGPTLERSGQVMVTVTVLRQGNKGSAHCTLAVQVADAGNAGNPKPAVSGQGLITSGAALPGTGLVVLVVRKTSRFLLAISTAWVRR